MSEVRSGAHAAAAAAVVAVVVDVRQPTAPHHAIEHQYNLGQREGAHSWRFIGGISNSNFGLLKNNLKTKIIKKNRESAFHDFEIKSGCKV